MIYADNAVTEKMNSDIFNVLKNYISDDCEYSSDIYAYDIRYAEMSEMAALTVSKYLNCKQNEVFFTSGRYESVLVTLAAALYKQVFFGKKHIISSYVNNSFMSELLCELERFGFEISFVNAGSDGRISPDDIEAEVRDDTCLVNITMADPETGILQPVSRIGKICRKRNILFYTDAEMTAGHIPVDVKRINADILTLSSKRFGVPQGAGVIYISEKVLESRPMMDFCINKILLREDINISLVAGMAAALENKCSNMSENASSVISMRKQLISGLKKIKGSGFNGNSKYCVPGIVNFSFEGICGKDLAEKLYEYGICVLPCAVDSSDGPVPSKILLAMGRSVEEIRSAVCISINEENTPKEIDNIINVFDKATAELRKAPVVSNITRE